MSTLKPPINKADHIEGNIEAPVTLVEFGDLQCPHCRRAYPIVKDIQKHFDQKLRFVFRHFPLQNAHPYALPAAIATEAAGKHKKFWEMHDIIYERQDELDEISLFGFAAEIGLKMEEFRKDIMDDVLLRKVEADFESGIRSGVNGTPTFFINGEKHNADFEYDMLVLAIEQRMHERV